MKARMRAVSRSPTCSRAFTNMHVTAHIDQSLVLGCSTIQDLLLQALCGHVNLSESSVEKLTLRTSLFCSPAWVNFNRCTFLTVQTLPHRP